MPSTHTPEPGQPTVELASPDQATIAPAPGDGTVAEKPGTGICTSATALGVVALAVTVLKRQVWE
jgi:hypothetical protein